tara:strand:+ start:3031 stop:4092 length:1062 start_codon:yes stop_codon:yes gene_type:complete
MRRLRTYETANAWLSAEMVESYSWIHEFSVSEVAELESAATKVLNDEIIDLSCEDFELPTLDPVLQGIRRDVVDGRGFALLRGLPVKKWPLALTARVYWAIGSRIGLPISQNRVGNLLGHVTDMGGEADHPNQRGHQSSDALPFHTDIGAEIVSLLCLRGARAGGESALSSAVAVWNTLVTKWPQYAKALTDTFFVDRRNEIVPGQDPWYELSIFYPTERNLISSFNPSFIRSAQRFTDAPRLSKLQNDAFDKVNELANDQRYKLEMDFRPGDIQLVNNLVVLHSRTEYEDWPEIERKRHLLRLWFAVPDGWEMPAQFIARHGKDPNTGRPRGVNLEEGATLNTPLTVPALRT